MATLRNAPLRPVYCVKANWGQGLADIISALRNIRAYVTLPQGVKGGREGKAQL
jgi:hypothetical protein